MNRNLPYTIESITGEKLTFLQVVNKDGLEYLEGINEFEPGAGPPMHVHYLQDEALTVVSGLMAYQEPGKEIKFARSGQTVLFKAGVPHKFWNAGKDKLHCRGWASPAGNMVYFLSQIYESMNKNGGRPGAFDAAYLIRRYKSEFGMLEIPVFVQRVIFPIIVSIGRLAGKYKKFRDAPEPIRA